MSTPSSPCRIKGPYGTVGDAEWECVTHGVEAELRDQAQFGHPPFRREDFICPVTKGSSA